MTIALDGEAPPERLDAIPEAAQPSTRVSHAEPGSVVGDLELGPEVVGGEAHSDGGRRSVLERVGYGFTGNEVQRRFNLRRPSTLGACAEVEVHCLRQPREPVVERSAEPTVRQSRRTDAVDELAQAADCGLYLVTDLAQGRGRRAGVATGLSCGELGQGEGIPTSCCWTPSCRSRSSDRRAWSSAVTIRARDSASSSCRRRA